MHPQEPETQENYYTYWGLTKPPFDNVPDPEMYFDMHTSVENAVSETLFAIEEGNECLAVIVGDVGLGKTMTLRVILDSLDADKYRIAFVTNPDMTFIQLMREIIGQLTGEQCTENTREKILEMFNQLLFATHDEGKKVLLFIDEGNAMKPACLESLRLLTNMQRDEDNLLTIILAGQLELAQRLEHPKRANLFQRIGVYCRLQKIDSRTLMRDYIEHRLERAGTTRRVFTDAAYDAIWECAEQGVPRLINKVAKLSLKAGQTQQLQCIDETIVHQVGVRFGRVSAAITQERRERLREVVPTLREAVPVSVTAVPSSLPPSPPMAQALPTPPVARSPQLQAGPESPPAPRAAHVPEEKLTGKQAMVAEMIKFPAHIYDKAKKLPQEQRVRFAGQLAAEVLKKYPHLMQQLRSNPNDPIPAWNLLRSVVLRQIENHLASEVVEVGYSL